jgi:hypothetical protein
LPGNNSTSSNYDTLHSFSITSGFVAGVNTIDFIATDFQNPGGLNVSGLAISASPVPEPSAAAIWLAGLIAVLTVKRAKSVANSDSCV